MYKICVLLDLRRNAVRNKLRGILNYGRLYGPIQFHLPDHLTLEQFRANKYDGIIVNYISESSNSEIIQNCNCPVVFIDCVHIPEKYKNLECYGISRSDGLTVGKMGADYLLKYGFKHFGFVDEYVEKFWSLERRKGFVDRLREKGCDCHVFAQTFRPSVNFSVQKNADKKRLQRWLMKLPKPIALMCACDERAHHVMIACQDAEISIPDDVSILGVDNDEMMCQVCMPQLSSIVNNEERGGFLAAELMMKLLRKPGRGEVCFYEPQRIHERKSVKIYSSAQPFVQEALEYIVSNAGIGINVDDVANHVHVVRRRLEKHFRKAIGKTVLEKIQDARFERICALLLETSLTVQEIAQICGYQSDFYIYTAFKKRFGITIREFRQQQSFQRIY